MPVRTYLSVPTLLSYIGAEIEKITSYGDIDDVILHDSLSGFLSPEIKFAKCIIEVAPDDPPLNDTPMIGGCHRYDYYCKIAIRAKGKFLKKLESVDGSISAGMWRLFKEINLQIGTTALSTYTEEPEGGTAISNIAADVDSDQAIISFDWTCRIITSEMS